MKALIRAIQTQYWAIEPQFASGYSTTLNQLFNHEAVDQLKEKELSGKAKYLGNSVFLFDEEVGEDEEKEGNINVIPIKGVVVKYDTLCELGTSSMAQMLEDGDNDDDVAFHLLHIDSGGGQVDGTAHFGNVIKSAKKPVVAYVDGLAGSAAYWIASQADTIIANDQTTMLGSIGTMIQFQDMTEFLESNGVKNIEVYADASTEKNKGIREVIKGNDKPLKETLNALNDQFLSAVESGRPDIDKEETLTGKVFIGQDAIRVGLADRIGSLSSAIELGFSLSNNNMFTSSSEKSKFFAEMGEFFGITPKANSNELTKAEQKEMIEQLESKIQDLNGQIEGLTSERTALEAELETEKAKTVEAVEDNKKLVTMLDKYSEKLEASTKIIEGYKAKESAPADKEVAVKAEAPEKSEGYEGMEIKPHNPFA
jgi:protease-4